MVRWTQPSVKQKILPWMKVGGQVIRTAYPWLHSDRINSVIEDRRKTILGKQPDLFGFPGADPALQIQRLVAAIRHQAS